MFDNTTSNKRQLEDPLCSVDTQSSYKRSKLQIEIPTSHLDLDGTSSGSGILPYTPDSLFDEASPCNSASAIGLEEAQAAWRTPPPIPGLFFDPSIRIPDELAHSVAQFCLKTHFSSPNVNQVMLFGRAPSISSAESSGAPAAGHSGLPPILVSLLHTLSLLLSPLLPPEIHELVFPQNSTRARQAILNLYEPGEGITAHVDLLRRFGDGIVGVSLLSGTVMQFVQSQDSDNAASEPDAGESVPSPKYDVYLPENSIIVMSGDSRYRWTHGIDRRTRDRVLQGSGPSESHWIERGARLSITFRWLLPGADIVGHD